MGSRTTPIFNSITGFLLPRTILGDSGTNPMKRTHTNTSARTETERERERELVREKGLVEPLQKRGTEKIPNEPLELPSINRPSFLCSVSAIPLYFLPPLKAPSPVLSVALTQLHSLSTEHIFGTVPCFCSRSLSLSPS